MSHYYVMVFQGDDPDVLRREVENVIAFVAEGDNDVDTTTNGPYQGDGAKQLDHAFHLLDMRVQAYGWEYDEDGTPLGGA